MHETLQSVSAVLQSTLESCISRLPPANECLSSRTEDHTNESEDKLAKHKSFLLPWPFIQVATRKYVPELSSHLKQSHQENSFTDVTSYLGFY